MINRLTVYHPHTVSYYTIGTPNYYETKVHLIEKHMDEVGNTYFLIFRENGNTDEVVPVSYAIEYGCNE